MLTLRGPCVLQRCPIDSPQFLLGLSSSLALLSFLLLFLLTSPPFLFVQRVLLAMQQQPREESRTPTQSLRPAQLFLLQAHSKRMGTEQQQEWAHYLLWVGEKKLPSKRAIVGRLFRDQQQSSLRLLQGRPPMRLSQGVLYALQIQQIPLLRNRMVQGAL